MKNIIRHILSHIYVYADTLLNRLLITASLCFIAIFMLSPHVSANTVSASQYAPSIEVRAIWMDRRAIPKSESEIKELIRKYRASGINMVLPEVIFNGYAAYNSDYLQKQDLWNGIDILSVIVRECHRYGIEVHPWVWVFRAGYKADMGGILSKYPDWALKDINGDILLQDGSYWLCPSNSEARNLLISSYKELVKKYKVDGLCFDYIRYPGLDTASSCFDSRCRKLFSKEKGIDPADIQPYTKETLDWHMFREEQINSFIAECSKELKKLNPRLKISAAASSPYSIARTNYLQDWGHWTANRWVDFILPMEYTRDMSSFARRMSNSSKNADGNALVVACIGAHILDDDQIVNQVGISKPAMTSGVSLFSSSYISDGLLNRLKHDVFDKSAVIPFRNAALNGKRLLKSAMERIAFPQSYNDLVNAYVDSVQAKKLLDYSQDSNKEIPYVNPTKPPIFIPDAVQPLPSMNAVKFHNSPIIDGLKDELWSMAESYQINRTNFGSPADNVSEIMAGYDNENIYFLITANEPDIWDLKANVTEHDNSVFLDDSFELFLDTNVSGKNIKHFVINTLGVKYDQKDENIEWSPDWDCMISKSFDTWTAEIKIPFKSLDIDSFSSLNIWRLNICRNRFAGAKPENTCWSVSYGKYNNPSRFGYLNFIP